MTWRMTAQGNTGIANNSTYDAWSPSRAYQHYHGGARILTETASADIASPITIPFDSLRPGPRLRLEGVVVEFPVLWQGGTWTIGDIVDYQIERVVGAARRPRRRAHARGSRASRAWASARCRDSARAGREQWPAAFVIPMQQPDQAPLRTLLRMLQRGQVEIRRATRAVRRESRALLGGHVRGAHDQPYGGVREGAAREAALSRSARVSGRPAEGAVRRHGADAAAAHGRGRVAVDSFPVTMTDPIAPIAPPKLEVPGLSGKHTRRIAIYRSWNPSMDEGWTRFVFDQYHIPFTVIGDREVHAGNLASRFDAIVIPDESPRGLQNGPREANYPDSLKGGLGAAGDAALHEFVNARRHARHVQRCEPVGDRVSEAAREGRARGREQQRLLRAGLALRAQHRRSRIRSIALMLAHPAAWFEDGPAFEITDTHARDGRRGISANRQSALLSGWLLGGEKLRGQAALVDVKRREGARGAVRLSARSTARRAWQCTRSSGRRCWGGTRVDCQNPAFRT